MPTITKNPDGSVNTINGIDINIVSSKKIFDNLSSSWPSVTANPATFNAKQFIADLANASGNDDWDGIVRNNPFYLPEYPIDPNNFKDSGDPRYPMNVAIKAMFDEFIPRQDAYNEVINAGGCQVINGYICNSDGVPVAKASISCTPDINLNIITPDEVKDFVNTSFYGALKKEADSFVNYLQNNYTKSGWTVTLYDLIFLKHFLLKISKPNNTTVYIKYFYDQKDYVSSSLQVPLIQKDIGEEFLSSNEDGAAFMKALKAGPPIYNQS